MSRIRYAKDLAQRLLAVQISRRFSVEEALQHPWITQDYSKGLPLKVIEMVQTNIWKSKMAAGLLLLMIIERNREEKEEETSSSRSSGCKKTSTPGSPGSPLRSPLNLGSDKIMQGNSGTSGSNHIPGVIKLKYKYPLLIVLIFPFDIVPFVLLLFISSISRQFLLTPCASLLLLCLFLLIFR